MENTGKPEKSKPSEEKTEKRHLLAKNHVNHRERDRGKRPKIPTKPRLGNRIAINAQINTPPMTECRAVIVPEYHPAERKSERAERARERSAEERSAERQQVASSTGSSSREASSRDVQSQGSERTGRTERTGTNSKNQSNSSVGNAIVPPPAYDVVHANSANNLPPATEREFHRELIDMMRESLRVSRKYHAKCHAKNPLPGHLSRKMV